MGQFDCIVVDYLHTRKFPVLVNVAKWGLRAATVATLVGVYQFNTNDIGASISVSRSVPTPCFPSIVIYSCLSSPPLHLSTFLVSLKFTYSYPSLIHCVYAR